MRDICWSPLKLAKHTSSYSLNQSSCHKHEGAALKKKSETEKMQLMEIKARLLMSDVSLTLKLELFKLFFLVRAPALIRPG